MTLNTTVGSKNENVDDNDVIKDENEYFVPIDGGWGWVVTFASFMIHIVTDGITYSFGMFYIEFILYFNEGKGYTSLILSILVGVTLCSGPISSSFVNKYGCRTVTIVGAIMASVCMILSMFARNVFTLILTIGIGTGFGFGLIYLPAIISVTTYFEKYRSLATGIAVCGSGLGTFIFAPVTESLIQNFGWRGACLILSGIVLNCIVFGAMFRPLKSTKVKETNQQSQLELNILNKNNITNLEYEAVPMIRASSANFQKNELTKNNRIDTVDERIGNNHISIRTTASQPQISSPKDEQFFINRKTLSFGSGTMYRPDVFYQGSLTNISICKSRYDMQKQASSNYGSLNNANELGEKSNQNCFQETQGSFKRIMDFSLILDPIFLIFVISNFCTSVGFNIPYVYLAAQAEYLGLEKEQGSYLISTIGIANTVGRIVLGYLSDKPWINRLLVYNFCLTVCGLSTCLSVFCHSFNMLAFYSSVFGFTIGAYVGLTSVILVDLLGLEKLTNAFGLLLLFQGIASLIGPPFAGWLYDVTHMYTPGFLLAGVAITFSGLILFLIPPIQRYVENKLVSIE